MRKLIWITAIVIALGCTANTFAQTATPGVTKEQVDQQNRIQNGKESGELTRREKRHLQMQQTKIQRDKKIAKSDGVVTPQERRLLHKEQRRASRNIYRQKHDNQTK